MERLHWKHAGQAICPWHRSLRWKIETRCYRTRSKNTRRQSNVVGRSWLVVWFQKIATEKGEKHSAVIFFIEIDRRDGHWKIVSKQHMESYWKPQFKKNESFGKIRKVEGKQKNLNADVAQLHGCRSNELKIHTKRIQKNPAHFWTANTAKENWKPIM